MASDSGQDDAAEQDLFGDRREDREIGEEDERMLEKAIISGVAHDTSEAKITVVGVPDKPGEAAAIFEQASSVHGAHSAALPSAGGHQLALRGEDLGAADIVERITSLDLGGDMQRGRE